MLRHSFATIEGSKILWHIVAPLPPSTPLFVYLYKNSKSESTSQFKVWRSSVCCFVCGNIYGLKRLKKSCLTYFWVRTAPKSWLKYTTTTLYVKHFLKQGCVWGNSLQEKLWYHLGKRKKLYLGSTNTIYDFTDVYIVT